MVWEGLLKAAIIADGRRDDKAEWSWKAPSASCERGWMMLSGFVTTISGGWRNACDSL